MSAEEKGKSLLMFGMTGSGKTRMVYALARSLHGKPKYAIREDLGSSADTVFNYPLVPWQWKTIVEATGQHGEEVKESKYILEKVINNITQQHRFTVFDGKGSLYKDMFDLQHLPPLVLKGLEKADGVIALLPVDKVNEKTLSELEYLADFLHKQKSKPEQNEKIPSRIPFMTGKKNIPQCKLAVCLHKVDLLKMRWEKAEDVFQVVFGSEWKNTKSKIETQYGEKIVMRLFVTSSLGFILTNDSKEAPNWVKDGDQIAYPSAWKPWNVERPFLWILEDEKEEEYPPYW